MSYLPLEFYKNFNGLFKVYLPDNETIIVYFDQSKPLEGDDKTIKLKQIIDLPKFKSDSSQGIYIREVPLKNIRGNDKIELGLYGS